MSHRLCAAAVAAALLFTATGCRDHDEARRDSERAVLTSQLAEVDAARSLARQTLEAQRQKVEALEIELANIKVQVADYQHRVQAFMLNHQMAVAAIAAGAAGGSVALDDSGRFTQQARDIGALVGMVAVGWALFNLDEVALVAQELLKAEASMQDLTRREAALALAVDQGRNDVLAAQGHYEQVNQQAASVRDALTALSA